MELEPTQIEWILVNRLKDSLLSTQYNHWNGLLTINSILMASLSVIGVLGKVNKCPVLLLMFFTIIPCVLVVWNFRTFESMYQELIGESTGRLPKPTTDNRDERLKRRDNESLWRYRRTLIVEYMLFIQAIALLAIVNSLK